MQWRPLSSAKLWSSERRLTSVPPLSPTPGSKRHLERLAVEVVHDQHRVVAPVVAQREDGRVAGLQDREVAPADLRHLLAHPDHALGPVEQRVRVAALLGDVDVLVAVGAARDHRQRPACRPW